MPELVAIELKAHVPARDFEVSKQFYQDIGFTLCWSNGGLALLHYGPHGEHGLPAFLLQDHYVKEFAENLQMHLLVKDVDAWWAQIQDKQIPQRYSVRAEPPGDRDWKMRDFTLFDPHRTQSRRGDQRQAHAIDNILLTYTCLSAGFFAGNAATMFLTHWLRAVMAAFGRGPVSAPHRIDALAVLTMTLLHPVPWMLLIGGWLGIHRVIFGPTIPEGWRWFWIGAGGWAVFVAAFTVLFMRRVRRSARNSR